MRIMQWDVENRVLVIVIYVCVWGGGWALDTHAKKMNPPSIILVGTEWCMVRPAES